MAILNKAAILEADDLVTETVPVPEWGGEVIIATLTGADRDAYEASIIMADAHGQVRNNFENMRAKLVARCLVGEDGARLFTDQEIADLGRKNAAALDRCYGVASRLNAVSESDLEELAKN